MTDLDTALEVLFERVVTRVLDGYEPRIRELVRQELEGWEIVDDPDPDPPPAPAPIPTTPPAAPAPRPPDPPSRPTPQLVIDVRAGNPATFGPGRTNQSQIVTAGAVFNFHNGRNDPTLDDLEGPLTFNPDDKRVHAFPMQDGTTVRFGPVDRMGRPWLRSAGQFVNDGSYKPENPSALRVGPGGSDKLFHDGSPRTQMAFIPLPGQQGFRCGPNADELVWGIEFIVEPWMFGKGHTTAPFELHAPMGANQTGPMTGAISRGHLRFWAKTDPGSPIPYPGQQPNNRHNVTLADIKLPEPGTSIVVVVAFRCDPSRPNGCYFEASTLANESLFGEKVNHHAGTTERFGYYYADHDRSGMFYPLLGQLYVPHKWWKTDWNWDSSTADGNVRRLDWAWAAIGHRGDIEPSDLFDHAKSLRA